MWWSQRDLCGDRALRGDEGEEESAEHGTLRLHGQAHFDVGDFCNAGKRLVHAVWVSGAGAGAGLRGFMHMAWVIRARASC